MRDPRRRDLARADAGTDLGLTDSPKLKHVLFSEIFIPKNNNAKHIQTKKYKRLEFKQCGRTRTEFLTTAFLTFRIHANLCGKSRPNNQ